MIDQQLHIRNYIQMNQYSRNNAQTLPNMYPISEGAYPSMDQQVKSSQFRAKIDKEQHEAILHHQKMETQIQKHINKIRVKGTQIHQMQLKYELMHKENVNLVNSLHENERLLEIQRQKYFGMDKSLSNEKNAFRNEKFYTNNKIQTVMEKTVQRHQQQVQDLNAALAEKYNRLQLYLKDRLNQKRNNRQKLSQIKEDIIKFKLNKQAIWDKVTLSASSINRSNWESQISTLQELISKAENSLKAQKKKSQYLAEQLTNLVMKGLRKQEKYQKDIFEIQNKIKQLHKQMTLANVDIEENNCQILLQEGTIVQKQADVELCRKYVKHIQSQSMVNVDMERLKNQQESKIGRINDENIHFRINDLQSAVRQQQSQNKMLKNHYQKMLAQLQSITKGTIHNVLFER